MLWRGFQKSLMEGKAVSGGFSLELFPDAYVTQKEKGWGKKNKLDCILK